ncbi:MAG TPA: sigma-70 family RNA polymerase sigma factor [Ktedonobacterales bacterium]|nr:sigma-70 family RNA polymerase sigma factor [Ktedonobacterales bacterium]
MTVVLSRRRAGGHSNPTASLWPVRSTRRRWSWLTRQPRYLIAQQPPDAHATTRGGQQDAAATISADCERFIREHERTILNYLWRMTGDEETASDLTQEVFLRAWQRFETIRAYQRPAAWLFRVATNLALTYLKRRSLPGASPATLDEDDGPATSDPAWHYAESDLIRSILLQLSPQRRAALVLREVYGLSAAEVGQVLGISDTALRMTLHRARSQFRELYLREGARSHGA